MHWPKRCPPKRNSASAYYGDVVYEEEQEVEITLMASSEHDNKMNILLGETLCHVLLDSGCSKSVCGKQWVRPKSVYGGY